MLGLMYAILSRGMVLKHMASVHKTKDDDSGENGPVHVLLGKVRAWKHEYKYSCINKYYSNIIIKIKYIK